ncbi:glutamine amidotransferase [Myxococcota bacterium]|nr:glutamine amidotransferase [Myxococcota bacterium]
MTALLGPALGEGGSLTWTSSDAVVGLAILAAAVAWLWAWWTGRAVGAEARGLRRAELVAWALALASLVVAVAGPVWVEESGRREPGKLVVLVDGSASMGVREGNAPRGEAVASILEALPSEAEVFTFDEDLRSGPPAGWTGRGTDVGLALSAVADRYLGQQLQGVVLITDGLDRGSLRRELARADAEGLPLSGMVPALPGPLTVYAVGQAEELYDVAIDEVQSGGFAFLRTPFTLTARVRGPAGKRLVVTLQREGRLVEEKELSLGPEGTGEVGFTVRPTKVGRFAYELSVPVEEQDAVPGNNRYPVVIRVVRDRTRVLQVTGSPSYDQKFLRLFLKEDPSVDLVSFFILRTRQDMGAGWHGDELSLIAFPYERLFSEELQTFDLVVLQNFDYAPYFEWSADGLLQNLADYVQQGGALVMTGGDRSFDLAGYGETPLADVLPVRLGVTGPRTDEARFRPVLTTAGRAHPLTRLGATPEESDAAWQRLPEQDGLNRVVGLAPDAAALLQHPTLRTEQGPAPVLAVREVGRGRSMALMVDASWRWSFSEAAQGRGNQAYLRFWKNALRWLVADPEDQRIVIVPARENVLLGDEVRIVVKVRDAGYLPVAGAKVRGEVTAPSGESTPFELVTDAGGEAPLAFAPVEQGAHRVVARSEGVPGQGETVFAVSDRDPELVEIVPDGRFLQRLALAYGDRATLRPAGSRQGPVLDPGAGREVMDRRETALASAPLVAVLFGLLSSLAWFLRRRAGAR